MLARHVPRSGRVSRQQRAPRGGRHHPARLSLEDRKLYAVAGLELNQAALPCARSFYSLERARLFSPLTTPPTLQDETARQAGAERNPLYTPEMLVKRDQLRTNPVVTDALHAAWERFKEARGDGDCIYWPMYQAMCRKIYILFKIQRREHYLEPTDALDEIQRDWPVDSGGKEHMTKDDFCLCFFQLADVHTDDVEAASYANLVKSVCEGITNADGGWVSDGELLQQLQAVCQAEDAKRRLGRGRFNSSTFGAGVRAWANAFDQPGLPGSLGYASRAASAGRRRSRSGERPGSGDGHDSARNPIQLRQYLTRGPDEWDPTVDFKKWLSARGSSGPPPRIDRPVASSTSASPPPERIGYGEPGSSTDSSLNPTPRKWRPTEGGPKPRSRRASDTELTFSGRNGPPQLMLMGGIQTSLIQPITVSINERKDNQAPSSAAPWQPPAACEPSLAPSSASSLEPTPREVTTGPLGLPDEKVDRLQLALATIPQSPSPLKADASSRKPFFPGVAFDEGAAAGDDEEQNLVTGHAPATPRPPSAAKSRPAATVGDGSSQQTQAEVLAPSPPSDNGGTSPRRMPRRQVRPSLPLSPGMRRSAAGGVDSRVAPHHPSAYVQARRPSFRRAQEGWPHAVTSRRSGRAEAAPTGADGEGSSSDPEERMAVAPAPSPAALHPQQLSVRPPKLHIDTSVSDAAPAETARPNSPASPSPPMAHAAAPPPSRNHSPQKAAMRSRVEHAEADDVIAHSGVRGVSGVLVGATLGEALGMPAPAKPPEPPAQQEPREPRKHSILSPPAQLPPNITTTGAPLSAWGEESQQARHRQQSPPRALSPGRPGSGRPFMPINQQLASGMLRSALRPLHDEDRTGAVTPPSSPLRGSPTRQPEDSRHSAAAAAAATGRE